MLFENRPLSPLDIDALRKRSGDSKADDVRAKESKRFDELVSLQRKLGDMRFAPAAIADLAKEGIKLPGHLVEAGIWRWEEKARAMLQEEAWALIVKSFSERMEPEIKRCLKATIKQLEADLEILETNARKISEKYGYAYEQGQAAVALTHAVNVFREEVEKPFDVSYHWLPKTALAKHFPS